MQKEIGFISKILRQESMSKSKREKLRLYKRQNR